MAGIYNQLEDDLWNPQYAGSFQVDAILNFEKWKEFLISYKTTVEIVNILAFFRHFKYREILASLHI